MDSITNVVGNDKWYLPCIDEVFLLYVDVDERPTYIEPWTAFLHERNLSIGKWSSSYWSPHGHYSSAATKRKHFINQLHPLSLERSNSNLSDNFSYNSWFSIQIAKVDTYNVHWFHKLLHVDPPTKLSLVKQNKAHLPARVGLASQSPYHSWPNGNASRQNPFLHHRLYQ